MRLTYDGAVDRPPSATAMDALRPSPLGLRSDRLAAALGRSRSAGMFSSMTERIFSWPGAFFRLPLGVYLSFRNLPPVTLDPHPHPPRT